MPKCMIFLALTLTGVLAFAAGCAVNPVTGDEELMFFSPDKDVAMGMQYAPSIERELGGRIDDENLQDYVNRVGQRIAGKSHRPDIAYYFTAVDTKMVNALALPGGYVFITRGLLLEMKSEGQLAGVLAHEIGHVVARDTMAAISREIGMVAVLAAVHVGADSSRAAHGADVVAALLSLQYTRDDEKDADMTGLSYMIQAGYDPNCMIETMQVLQDLQTVRPIEFFSTHPNPESRIAYLQERIDTRYTGMGALKEGEQEYEEAVLSKLKKHRIRDDVAPATAGSSQEKAGP